MLSTFDLAPALYMLANEKGSVMAEYLVTENVSALPLSLYTTMVEYVQDMETKPRVPGLKVSDIIT